VELADRRFALSRQRKAAPQGAWQVRKPYGGS